jgi:hypothetical protein
MKQNVEISTNDFLVPNKQSIDISVDGSSIIKEELLLGTEFEKQKKEGIEITSQKITEGKKEIKLY